MQTFSKLDSRWLNRPWKESATRINSLCSQFNSLYNDKKSKEFRQFISPKILDWLLKQEGVVQNDSGEILATLHTGEIYSDMDLRIGGVSHSHVYKIPVLNLPILEMYAAHIKSLAPLRNHFVLDEITDYFFSHNASTVLLNFPELLLFFSPNPKLPKLTKGTWHRDKWIEKNNITKEDLESFKDWCNSTSSILFL
jgi:hypothetical protein